MTFNNSDLALSFPMALRDDALQVTAILPQPTRYSETYSIKVGAETLLIPYRVYHDPALIVQTRLTPLQVELFDCLLTRHHSGFVREKHLKKIISSDQEWIPAFVVQLVGEYVIEILETIRNNLHCLNRTLYQRFLKENPKFLALTKQRVWSYWNCYHRNQPTDHYAALEIMELLDNLTTERG